MTTSTRKRTLTVRFLGRLACTALLVCGLGGVSESSLAAVTVDSGPLIQQPSVPPNIVLMLDDSGSMAWDVMPDYGSLSATTADALVSSSVNGVYYNPQTTYSPPPLANPAATPNAYPDASFVSAWINGFKQSAGTVNLSRYDGSSDSSKNGANSSSLAYSKSYSNTSNTYSPTMVCNSGDTGPLTSGSKIGQCQKTGSGGTISYYAPTATCDSGSTYTSSTKLCKQSPVSLFTYTVKSGSSYTRYYIASHTGDCAAAGVSTSVCSEKPSDQQNAANWFSYYHTRILMAQSGLMNAFVGLNSNYRVGFGSIDGGGSGNSNYKNLPGGSSPPKVSDGANSTLYPYTDTYNSGTNYIALVKPFGDGSQSNDQKSLFWNWVSKVQASGGTPLRQALNAVGSYYTQDQPWSTMSTDPVVITTPELACRQSYTILTTDGFWNESNSPGVGNFDGTSATSAITGPNQQSYTYTAKAPYSDSQPNTLADVAMKYWATDLRKNTLNEVPINSEDKAFWQHMVTFTMGLGFTPSGITPATTTPSGDQIADIFTWANGTSTPTWAKDFSWPVPAADNINNIADLAHAAVNGHGGFYSATSPTAFTNGLAEALKRATERTGTGSSLAANSTQLQSGTFAYQATYHTSLWTGDLMAYQIDSTTGTFALNPNWTASQMLPVAASRNIYTYNPSSQAYLAFQMNGTTLPALSTGQLTALGSSASAQTDMINYLRGDQSKEVSQKNGVYRTRATPIGDIVNSQPVYVGAPTANQFLGESFSAVSSYSTYATGAAANRAGTLYVAANDGYLHAFNASTGVESYAYLPGAVITGGSATGIVDLSNKNYGADSLPHQFFNDGELTVADVYVGKAWKTVLVGTTGRGLARAVYALDVTDPTKIKFLWERSAADSSATWPDDNSKYIGQMTGKPVVAQVADGTWAVLIGNGYNSAAGKSALLQFALADGALSVYTTTDTTGLAAPAVWMNSPTTGISTVAYAGDLNGNVWSFDLTGGSSAGTLLFTATDSSKKRQPITAGMLVGKNSNGDVWLFFGTGKYLTHADLSDTSTQTWYGLIVSTPSSSNTAISAQTDKTRASLVQRYITSETAAVTKTLADGSTQTTSAGRTVTTTADAASMTGLSGWFMDLQQPSSSGTGSTKTTTYKQQGERMVTPNQFQGSYLLGTTRIPNSDDACNPSGTGWVMAVDPFTGTNPQTNFFDLNGDGKVNSSDGVNGTPSAGIGFSSLPNNPIFTGGTMLTSFDNGSHSSIQTSGGGTNKTRVSWRELIAQ
ncbi:pilus assembly protein [Dyella amyloliquefaciens]|uniref:pilus assembly protein n=1 Tax=Dyella amyloliquefaciens TaxID=1770545 RepID=UPI00102E467E|nr:PilC/PilY family type IV pilus protein [Dyella amyloliquefaciens]